MTGTQTTFSPGTKVARKADGTPGTVISNDGREIVVRFDALGRTLNSPWGTYKDAGSEGHILVQFAHRLIAVQS